MELKVVNALNRDVEREQLNKILKHIAARLDESDGVTEAQVRRWISELVPEPAPATNRTISVTLTGDAEGTGSGTTSIDIPVTLNSEVVKDAPLDGFAYWRQDGDWAAVPYMISSLTFVDSSGMLVYDAENLDWVSREIEVEDGQLVISDGDGLAGNPTLGLAEVEDSGTGTLVGVDVDEFGRVTGTVAVTTDDLKEGDVNLYYTDARAAAAAPIQSIVAGANVSIDDTDPANPVITATAGAGAVDSVNGYTGTVQLSANDVGADPSGSAAAALSAAIEFAAGKLDKPTGEGDDAFLRGDGWSNWIDNDFRVGTPDGLYGSGRELAVSAGATGDNIAHFSLQGSRTANGIFGTLNYFHQGEIVVSMGAGRDGADDAGYWVITTKPAGGPLANRVRITSDGNVLIGSSADNGAGRLVVNGNVSPSNNNVSDLGTSSVRWRAGYIQSLRPGAGTAVWTSGAGTPEGVVAAPIGSLYTRTNGGAGTTLYVKESGSGNTGWVAK